MNLEEEKAIYANGAIPAHDQLAYERWLMAKCRIEGHAAGERAMRDRAFLAHKLSHLERCRCKRCKEADRIRALPIEAADKEKKDEKLGTVVSKTGKQVTSRLVEFAEEKAEEICDDILDARIYGNDQACFGPIIKAALLEAMKEALDAAKEVAENYDGPGIHKTGYDCQLGDAGRTMGDIAKEIDALKSELEEGSK